MDYATISETHVMVENCFLLYPPGKKEKLLTQYWAKHKQACYSTREQKFVAKNKFETKI